MKRFNINFLFLLISIFLLEISNFGQNVIFINKINNYLFDIGLLIGFLNSMFIIIQSKINIKRILLILLLSIISFFVKFKTGDNLMIEIMILFISSLNSSFDKVIKYDFIFKILLLLFIIFCYFFNLTAVKDYIENGEKLYSFGFKNPNTTGFYIILLLIEYFYIIREKINLKKVILPLTICIILIMLTKSRTSMLALILFLFIYLIKKCLINSFSYKKKKIYFVYFLFALFSLFSLYITLLYLNGNNFALKLDKILSARIWSQSYYYKIYPICFFGNKINYIYTIDNAYMRLLLNFGYNGILFYSIIYGIMFKKAIKNKDVLFYSVILTLLLYGLSEWCIVRPGINILLLYCSCDFLKKSSKEVN